MQINVFTYGSLMFDAVWQRLVQENYRAVNATLYDYRRLRIRHDTYPVALPYKGSKITGVLYLGVNKVDLATLDEFEGDYYYREAVTVSTIKRELIPAEVYILKARYRHLASVCAWDSRRFKAWGLKHFLQKYKGFT